MTKKQNRYTFIDIAAGIAIILVVFGHMHFPEVIKSDWYLTIRDLVYKIHMPLFMFISGFVSFLSASKQDFSQKNVYWKFILQKAKKFIPAYLFFGFLAIGIDLFYLKLPSEIIQFNLKALLLFPIQGSAGFIWYLYVLFGFYLITPLFIKLNNSIKLIVLVLAFILSFIPATANFSINLFLRYSFFFFSGGILFLNNDHFVKNIRKIGWAAIFLSAITLSIELTNIKLPFQLLSILFIPAVLFITSIINDSKFSQTLATIGQGSFAIYLFDSIILNSYYIIIQHYIVPFPINIFIVSGLIIGVVIPLIVRFYFNKIVPKSIYML